MNKKLTIYSISLLLLALGSFFVYKEISNNNSKVVVDNSYPNMNSATSTDTSIVINKLDCSEVKDFLDHSFVFSVNFNAEVKNAYSKKISDTVSILKADCNAFSAWLDLGIYASSIGDYDSAKISWETASKIQPNYFLPYHNLGNLYGFSLKDLPKAEEYYFKAISKNFESLNSYSDLADLYLYGGQVQKAITLLTNGLNESVSTNSHLFFLQKLAFVYRESGDKANALKYYEKLLSADPANDSVRQEVERFRSLQ